MHLLPFAAGVFTLLILPGPTNAILAMASQGLTFRRSIALLATVLSAYLAIVLPASGLAGSFLRDHPLVSQGVKLISATWVLYLALRLWGVGSSHIEAVSVRQLGVTTLLNPKALIIGLTMVPPTREVPAAAAIATLASVVLVVSSIWLSIGALILGREKRIPALARRCGSATLVAFSAVLTFSAFGG
ncbi:threonine transporter RhtB [Rhizobium lentis]|uniref:Threonine transporter RhtB n=1 Tax=Rhizobium lentis TaxID=1138194 RepID=A0A9Q3R1F3_9HYPH|nr:threonine transporter RhtB [Rhizobium lentis]MBX5024967.1 threonine transporter RhtB [Rhizobium lentis]MBX5067079.1 threonine transporter RhtB [Rhizobium lentis]MBX5078538.1 threonine transporter RhtB [Rhizobium lentis]MBX5102671.1 threonine transporter RhtB [Rhizobium lentis]MBX5147794.1 threonine transporter RhtB [Rhizobium lentis]